ncbi:MAG: hypothetical protein OEZ06_25455 [Myxococcales bacterium]|nr:hypothetical protein [Myxococcales bacterium]
MRAARFLTFILPSLVACVLLLGCGDDDAGPPSGSNDPDAAASDAGRIPGTRLPDASDDAAVAIDAQAQTDAAQTGAQDGSASDVVDAATPDAATDATTDATTDAATDAASPDTGPPAPTELLLFASAPVDGDIAATDTVGSDARTGADGLCAAATIVAERGCTEARALLSIASGDRITQLSTNHGLPATLPFKGPNGTQVAADYASLLAGPLDSTLEAAGVFATTTDYWTGTKADLSLALEHCTGWTTNTSSDIYAGRIGRSDGTDSTWLDVGFSRCDFALPLLCACW